MKRYVSGLSKADPAPDQGIPDGVFLVRVERAQYRWHAQKPYFSVVFLVLEPVDMRGRRFSARLYATAKALWKLNWFLRDLASTQNCSDEMRSMTSTSSVFVAL